MGRHKNATGPLLVAKMAGRAAEEVFFGSCIAGSGCGPESDLATATVLALQMEVSLGYGTDMPLLYRNAEETSALLIYRSDIAKRVNSRLEKAYADAMQLMRTHRASVTKLASVLINKGTLDGPELRGTLNDIADRPPTMSWVPDGHDTVR